MPIPDHSNGTAKNHIPLLKITVCHQIVLHGDTVAENG